MYGLVIDGGWRNYYAHSPYNNLIASAHGNFDFFDVGGNPIVTDPDKMEAILSCEGLVVSPGLEGLLRSRFSGPILTIGDDMHRFDQAGLDQLLQEINQCDYFLTPYSLSRTQTSHPYRYLPGWLKSSRLIFYPNCAPSSSLRPEFPEPKRAKAFLTGQVSQPYPVRMLMLEHGDDLVEVLPFKQALGGDYFEALASYRVGLTCNLWVDSTVAKYYEIPWAGSLLVAPLPYDAFERRLLGFEDSVNMIAVSEGDFEPDPQRFRDKVNWALSDPEAAKIREAGTKLVLDRHTVDSRLMYLERLLDAIVAGGFHIDDQYDIFDGVPSAEHAPPI